MSESMDRVRSSDWAALLRLAAEVADLPASTAVRRRHILSSAAALVGADMASVFDARPDAAEVAATGVAHAGSLISINISPVEHGRLHEFLTSVAGQTDPVTRSLTHAVLARRTVLREHFADSTDWYRCDHYEQVQRPLKMDDQLSCRVTLPDGSWAGVAFLRRKGGTPFDERARQVMDLFHTHAAHLYVTPKPPLEGHLARLPPRLRPVLQGLVDGDAEKQVAAKLGLSPHTVHQYVKTIYRAMGVGSRGELFARLGQSP